MKVITSPVYRLYIQCKINISRKYCRHNTESKSDFTLTYRRRDTVHNIGAINIPAAI